MSAALLIAADRWGSATLLEGGWKLLRAKPCKNCGGRYRARHIFMKARWKWGQPLEDIGLCPEEHPSVRWPAERATWPQG